MMLVNTAKFVEHHTFAARFSLPYLTNTPTLFLTRDVLSGTSRYGNVEATLPWLAMPILQSLFP